jgi:hypothetical protein
MKRRRPRRTAQPTAQRQTAKNELVAVTKAAHGDQHDWLAGSARQLEGGSALLTWRGADGGDGHARNEACDDRDGGTVRGIRRQGLKRIQPSEAGD